MIQLSASWSIANTSTPPRRITPIEMSRSNLIRFRFILIQLALHLSFASGWTLHRLYPTRVVALMGGPTGAGRQTGLEMTHFEHRFVSTACFR